MAALHRQRVLGTAGHIDHGKTALIRALTGVECDRLPEEQKRGITLELGFAPLDLPDGTRLSVIDVPGHEGLVRTMVSGATGIDLLLLVVAADEGVMPQTREHVAIASLLGIETAVVALTKCDVADADTLELASEEVRELLAPTALAGAPIVVTSANEGTGIDALREALLSAVTRTEARARRAGIPRLAIDRSFVAHGFGAIVTGTLVGGEVREGETLCILPGKARARVRGVECHGEAVASMAPGARCALNLQGVELGQVPRGAVVTRPDAIDPTSVLDVRLRWLSDAPTLDGPTSGLFLAGTSEHAARIAPMGSDPIPPGGSGFARIHLERGSLPLLPGDRFVVRGFTRNAAGGHTLGGGTVLDTAPPRRRLSDPSLVRDLDRLESADAETALTLRVAREGLAGIRGDALARQTGFEAVAIERELGNAKTVLATRAGTWLALGARDRLEETILGTLIAFHEAEPRLPGMPAGALRGALPANVAADVVEHVLEHLVGDGRIHVAGGLVRASEHQARLPDDDVPVVAALREGTLAAGLTPPTLREWCERLTLEEARARDLLGWLERSGEVVRAPGDLFFAAGAVEGLRERVRAHFASHDRLETVQYKELIGTTRKHAVPLMELLDSELLTARRGDARILRKG